MLAFLTDCHISPHVAEQIVAKRPEITAYSLQKWRGGAFLQAEDEVILAAAMEDNLTFVTYDQRTIAPLLVQWAIEARSHAGVVFVDQKSIIQEDIGGKVRALLELWDKTNKLDWKNAISFLRPEKPS